MAHCPAHADSKPSLAIRCTPAGKLLVHCHAGCEQTAVVAAIDRLGFWRSAANEPHDATAVAANAVDKRFAAAMAIWAKARTAHETVVSRYLNSRAIVVPVPDSIRFAPALRHRSGSLHPAMVALVTNAEDDRSLGVHRTYLSPDGSGKAALDPERQMLGPCIGGVVRLATGEGPLLVGEGIETCLSAFQATGLPTWAALSASGLRSLVLPARSRDVIVLVDGDDPGRSAAAIAARRWTEEGRRVRLAVAPDGLDFNDVLQRGHEPGGRQDMSALETSVAEMIGAAPEFVNESVVLPGKPKLLVDPANPDETVRGLVDILAQHDNLFDRGALVSVIQDEINGSAVASEVSPDALVMLAHKLCRPYAMRGAKG